MDTDYYKHGVLGRGAIEPVAPSGPWVRPADWLVLPEITDVDHKFVGLRAIFPDSTNFCAIMATGGLYTIDWGDGTVENIGNFTQANHTYDYNNIALDGTLTSRGYKQAVVTITPQPGEQLTGITLRKHTTVSLQTALDAWLDMAIVGSNINSINLSVAGQMSQWMLEKLVIKSNVITNWTSLCADLTALRSVSIYAPIGTTFAFMFARCYNLQKVDYLHTPLATTYQAMFQNCYSLLEVPEIACSSSLTATAFTSMFDNCFALQKPPVFVGVTTSATNLTSMFSGCKSLRAGPALDTSAAILFYQWFIGCVSLVSVPDYASSEVTDFNGMFSGCVRLQKAPMLNTAKGTDFSSMFLNCGALASVPEYVTSEGLNFSSMFNGCTSLKEAPALNTIKGTVMNAMFNECRNLIVVPLLNTALNTNFTSMFFNCFSLNRIPTLNTSSGTLFTNMFGNCQNLLEIPDLNTVLGTTFGGMFNGCRALRKIGAMNLAGATSSTNYNSMFSGCVSLAKMTVTGLKFTANISNASLSSTALNEIYTNLETVVGQTLTVSGNWGAAGDDPSIATAKGWTVTG